ncbi:MAG: GNAT family N-acetyltransferase [Faecousia sp.]
MAVLHADKTLLEQAAALFSGWNETLITSCLQGVMGCVYVDGNAAAAYLGDLSFYAGTPSEELLRFKPNPGSRFVIMVPGNEQWNPLLEQIYGERAKKVTRYAFGKNTVFDRTHLEALKARLPEGYTMELLGEDVYDYCRKNEWCRDWVSQFDSFGDFRRRGLGMVVKKDGIPVSGASSYSIYQEGIEIQIDTREDHRRQGLATAAAAGLILECLDRGLYPSWDAANLWSVALAEKLGYRFDHEYDAYFVNW